MFFYGLDTLNNFGIACFLKVTIEFFSEKNDFLYSEIYLMQEKSHLFSIAL